MKFLAFFDVNRHPQPSLPFHTSSCVRRSDAGPELAVRSELLSHSAPLDLVLAPSPQPQTISALGLFSLGHVTVCCHMRPVSLTRYSYALEVCRPSSRKPLSSCSGNNMDGSALQPPTGRRLVWASPQLHDRLWTLTGSAINPRRIPDASSPCTGCGR